MLNESIATIYKKAGDDNYNKINTDEKKSDGGWRYTKPNVNEWQERMFYYFVGPQTRFQKQP